MDELVSHLLPPITEILPFVKLVLFTKKVGVGFLLSFMLNLHLHLLGVHIPYEDRHFVNMRYLTCLLSVFFHMVHLVYPYELLLCSYQFFEAVHVVLFECGLLLQTFLQLVYEGLLAPLFVSMH